MTRRRSGRLADFRNRKRCDLFPRPGITPPFEDSGRARSRRGNCHSETARTWGLNEMEIWKNCGKMWVVQLEKTYGTVRQI